MELAAKEHTSSVIRRAAVLANFLVLDRFQSLFRAIGLRIITFRDRPEPPKILLDKSRKLALALSAIHIVPSAVSIVFISINFVEYFIGNELPGKSDEDDVKMGILQVVAKIQVCFPNLQLLFLSTERLCWY